MKIFKARIHITLKPGIPDPQGKAIFFALKTLGYSRAKGVKTGKYFEIELTAKSQSSTT